jgi:hypothetical protein
MAIVNPYPHLRVPLGTSETDLAEAVRLWTRHREAVRRVDQDYAAFGAPDRDNERRLADVRREMAHRGVSIVWRP